MNNKRVVILDGSYPLFSGGSPKSNDENAMQTEQEASVLLPIPHFRETLLQAIRSVVAQGKATPGRFAMVDVGIVCDAGAVTALGREIHRRVVQSLKQGS